jgi:hypothetical protein
MCRIPPHQTTLGSAVPVASSARRKPEVDSLLRELAYVYRLAERVREEIVTAGGMSGARVTR